MTHGTKRTKDFFDLLDAAEKDFPGDKKFRGKKRLLLSVSDFSEDTEHIVEVRRRKDARTMRLRFEPFSRSFIISVPLRMSAAKAYAFAASHLPWMRTCLQKQKPPIDMTTAKDFPFGDTRLRIRRLEGSGLCRRKGQTLYLYGDANRQARGLYRWISEAFGAAMEEICARRAAACGRPYSRVVIRPMRVRWGSCSAAGRLCFNFYLAFAPTAIWDHIAAHEVAHLSHLNHSPLFHAHLKEICPEQETADRWLEKYGSDLMRYHFSFLMPPLFFRIKDFS